MSRSQTAARRRRQVGRASALLTLIALIALAAPALAQAAEPWWHVEARAAPTNLPPSGAGKVLVTAADLGDAPANGKTAPIVVTDHLPSQLTVATRKNGEVTEPDVTAGSFNEGVNQIKFSCTVTGSVGSQTVTCTSTSTVPAFEAIEVAIGVTVTEEHEATLANDVTVEGGGAERAASCCERGLQVSSAPSIFGVEALEETPENEGGSQDEQAGSHPFQLATTLNLNQILAPDPQRQGEILPSAPGLFRDVQLKVPPGLLGTANSELIPQCSSHDFSTFIVNGLWNACPENTAIGVALVDIHEPELGTKTLAVPVFNLVPEKGEPARFGFVAFKVPVTLDTKVRTGGDYGVNVTVRSASQAAGILGSRVTLWGNPLNAEHNEERGWQCLVNGGGSQGRCKAPEPHAATAFLSLPTSCGEPLVLSSLMDSWGEPGATRANGEPEPSDPRWLRASSETPALKGCEALPFEPSISVVPDTGAANTPSGFKIDVHLPQSSTLSEEGLAEAAVRDSTVTLPPGVLLSPSGANGLLTCPEGLVGASPELINETPQFTPEIPEPEDLAPGLNFCPNASKVGIVRIKTPDLKGVLEGGVYLASQNANPFGSNFAMYIIAQDPESKVTVKLAGEIKPDPATGQITTVFKNTPDVPFEDLELELMNGSRASLSTPPTCGNYTTTTSFTPWSGKPAQGPTSTFAVTSGAEGSGCANPLPLSPVLAAGTPVHQAGAFTPFELTLAHHDTDQAPTSLTVHLPAGLAGIIKNVTLCPEAQANAGTCPAASLIGHATAVAGLGGTPYTETGGEVFLTEKVHAGRYAGAPFGLSVVIPAKTPAFDFGNVVTRAALRVDPNTTAVTIESELPTMINTATFNPGVPVQLKEIHVVTDRPEFQFNPTNCTPSSISATVTGTQGGVGSASVPFQVANCSTLPFHPELTAETKSHYTKTNGDSLVVKVTSAKGQANIGKTKVAFPEQFPSRLTTLQHACADKVFDENPALCPDAAIVGTAVAHTPVFANPLVGPAILVSHGNAKFPDVEFLLQGEGVEVILDGSTDIKHGVTTSTFESVPDAPVTEFVVTLPEGPHSAFTGYANLCAPSKQVTSKVRVAKKVHHRTVHVLKTVTKTVLEKNLTMPTTLTGQNGDVIQKTTVVKVAGCPTSSKKATTVKKAKRKKKKKKKK